MYSIYTDSKAAFSGDSVIMTNDGSPMLRNSVGKLLRGYNGAEWSYTHVVKSKTPQPLFEVKLADGRSLKCSLDTYFFINENFNSLSLRNILIHYQQFKEVQPEIYTNCIKSSDSYEYQHIVSCIAVKNDEKYTYYVDTIDAAHRAFINNILLRCW